MPQRVAADNWQTGWCSVFVCDLRNYDNNKPSAFHENSSQEINKTKTMPSVLKHSHANEMEVRSSLWGREELRQAAACSAMTVYESQYDNLTDNLSQTHTSYITTFTSQRNNLSQWPQASVTSLHLSFIFYLVYCKPSITPKYYSFFPSDSNLKSLLKTVLIIGEHGKAAFYWTQYWEICVRQVRNSSAK